MKPVLTNMKPALKTVKPTLKPKYTSAIAVVTALLCITPCLTPVALAEQAPAYWVNTSWPGTESMLGTLDILQTVNVKNMEKLSSLPVSQLLQEKASMNEVVQQLESAGQFMPAVKP